jgi:hypothetical protein
MSAIAAELNREGVRWLAEPGRRTAMQRTTEVEMSTTESGRNDDTTPVRRIAENVRIGGNLTVGSIGYGAIQLTGPKVWGEHPDQDNGVALLRGAVAEGVAFIDTADVYGPHSNEQLIREALHAYPEHVVVATKGGFVPGGPS